MRTLLTYLRRHYYVLLFIILEAIALTIFVNNNRYPRTAFFNTTNQLTGSVNKLFSNISGYFNLKRNNKILAEENTALRNRLSTYYRQPFTSYYYFKDSLYRYFPADVIYNSTRRRNNYLMLDKGRNDGVRKEMGVISSNGAVGIVIEVSDNYSTVMSLLHKNAKISAKIKKNGQLVSLVWDGKKISFGLLEDIPTHLSLAKGDTIITSGFSFIFPEGITLGTVEKYMQNPEQNLNQAIIRYSTDFNNLDHVYVVENLKVDEQKTLLNQSLDESAAN